MAKVITVKKAGGRVSMSDDLAAILSTLRNGNYTLTLKRSKEERSIPQNDLLWMWMACIERETGTPKIDVYQYYCRKFLSKTVMMGRGMVVVNETSSQLTVQRFTMFLEQIKADALVELGISLPEPQDRHFEYFYNQFNDV